MPPSGQEQGSKSSRLSFSLQLPGIQTPTIPAFRKDKYGHQICVNRCVYQAGPQAALSFPALKGGACRAFWSVVRMFIAAEPFDFQRLFHLQ